MRYLTRTMILIVVFSIATVSPAMDQARSEGKAQTFIISGSVGMGGVTMMGLPGEPVTDNNGFYSATVEYGWAGKVEPAKEGFVFEPANRKYTKVIADQTDENYTPKIIRYTISGQVGASFIVMQGLPGNPVTDENGYYTCTVDYGWAGTVKPVKEGYTFNPPEMRYTKVMRDQKKQNYTTNQPTQVWQFKDGRWEPIMGAAVDSRSSRRVTRTTGFRPIDSRKVLMVPSAQVNSKDLAEIIEDMQVMSLILDERFKETRRVQGVFTDFGDFFGRDNRQTEATYLQGYGVLFSMEVNFAFSPPPKQQEQQTEQTIEPVDSTWEKARQQMFSPGTYKGTGQPNSTEEYDSRMVEELKRDLITTLKHAANIRGVQPDEWIILTVIGSGRQSGSFGGGGFMMGGMGGMYGGTSSGGMMGGMGGGMMGGGMGGMGGMGGFSEPGVFSEMGVSPATVLTIRAKKSDIDAYAKDEQLSEQFRRRVQIFIY